MTFALAYLQPAPIVPKAVYQLIEMAYNSCRTWPLGRLCLTYLTHRSGEHSGRYNTFVKKPWMDEDGKIIWNHWRTLAAKAAREPELTMLLLHAHIVGIDAIVGGHPLQQLLGIVCYQDGRLGQMGSCSWIRLMPCLLVFLLLNGFGV